MNSEPIRYQTHHGQGTGMSDSATKLVQLQLPPDLRGKRVLDIGCNEGYFSAVAAELGASEVIGIDILPSNIEFAQARYGHLGIEFRVADWHNLPDGPFDLVLWTSSMHYERAPRAVLRRVHEILRPTGMLVLECGVSTGQRREMVPYQRYRDHHWYPTSSYLMDVLLPDFAVRQVSWNKVAKGDPVPRSVFHCTRRRPVVLLVSGPTRSGKSSLARLIEPAATSVISLDEFVLRIKRGEAHQTPLQKLVRDRFSHDRRDELYREVDERGLSDELADAIAGSITSADRLAVIDGAFTSNQVDALRRRLAETCEVWDVSAAGEADLPSAIQATGDREPGSTAVHTPPMDVAPRIAAPAATQQPVVAPAISTLDTAAATRPLIARIWQHFHTRLQLLVALSLPQIAVPLVWRNPLFDRAWYLERNRDVASAGADPDRHYRLHGSREGRDPCPLFHTKWYVAVHAGVATSRLNPLDHYFLVGSRAGMNPSPMFDSATYLTNNPDVARSGVNPLLHYLRYGMAEGRVTGS